jgi:hypothetical protein
MKPLDYCKIRQSFTNVQKILVIENDLTRQHRAISLQHNCTTFKRKATVEQWRSLKKNYGRAAKQHTKKLCSETCHFFTRS